MSDGNNVIPGPGMKKGFRQTKAPTKGQVQQENMTLAEKITRQLVDLRQQMYNLIMASRKTQQEVRALANLLRGKATSGPIAKGDFVMIDYFGQLVNEDGSLGPLFDGGFSLGDVYEIGSGSLVAGFEEQLVGHSAGDQFAINITFPKEYASDLADKKAAFQVKIIGAWTPVDPSNTIETLYLDLKKAEQELNAKLAAAEEAALAAPANPESATAETPSTEAPQEA